jgi:hypothetical protein
LDKKVHTVLTSFVAFWIQSIQWFQLLGV